MVVQQLCESVSSLNEYPSSSNRKMNEILTVFGLRQLGNLHNLFIHKAKEVQPMINVKISYGTGVIIDDEKYLKGCISIRIESE